MIMIALKRVVMLLSASSLFLPAVYAQSELQAMPQLDRILSGSFAFSAIGEPRDGGAVLLASWNTERGVRRSEILGALRGPLAADLYVLQEVDLNTRRAGFRNVAGDLARELAMNYAFGIEFQELAQGRRGQPAFHGQAVLSRFPIRHARVLRFRHQLHNWGPRWRSKLRWSWLQPRKGGRIALVVEIDLRGQTWAIYDAHLESKANDAGRARQMREILEDVQSHYGADTPVIVAGDLNTRGGAASPVLQELRAHGFEDVLRDHRGSVATKVGSNRREDWIFVRRLRPLDARTLKTKVSDHYPLFVRIAAAHPL